MKQTAVEWLIDELQKAEYIPKDSIIMAYVIEQAKEMEKQQIIDALRQGVNIELGINEFKENYLTYSQNFDRYYNLKYGNDKNLQTKHDQ